MAESSETNPSGRSDNLAGEAVGRRVRDLRVARGWGIDELARRANLSRTTLHHLEKGQTPHPRAATLKKLAEAFQMRVSRLISGPPSRTSDNVLSIEEFESADLVDQAARLRFDHATNPVVDEVRAERARLFTGWSEENWDELYSEFGIGGALTFEGVVRAAETINRKRETLRQLSVVLDTELGDVASRIVTTLHAMVDASGRHNPGVHFPAPQ